MTYAESQTLKRTASWAVIVVLFGFFIYEIRTVLSPFVIGMLAAYFLHPAADKLEKKGIPRGLAAGAILSLFLIVLAVALVLIVPMIVHQSAELAADVPVYISELATRYEDDVHRWLNYLPPDQVDAVKNAAGNNVGALLQAAGGVVIGMFASGMAVLNVLALVLITPLVAFFLLRDWEPMTQRLDRLLPRASADTIRIQLRRIDETLAGFLRGQMNVCLILAAYYGLFLTITGLKFGLVIGLVSGLMVILPYIGPISMFLLAAVVGFIQFGFTQPLFMVIGVYGVGQLIESYFLTPRLVGERVGLHPLWIIFGMLAGGALFGFVGVLIAVPATAVIGVLIRFAVERYLESPLYQDS